MKYVLAFGQVGACDAELGTVFPFRTVMPAQKFTIASITQSRNCSLIAGTEVSWLELARLTQAAVLVLHSGGALFESRLEQRIS